MACNSDTEGTPCLQKYLFVISEKGCLQMGSKFARLGYDFLDLFPTITALFYDFRYADNKTRGAFLCENDVSRPQALQSKVPRHYLQKL